MSHRPGSAPVEVGGDPGPGARRTLAVVTTAPSAPGPPAPLRLVAAVVVAQGLGLLVLAILGAFDLAADRVSAGVSVSVFLAVYGVALLACAWALVRLHGWARGPVLITQLIQLGLAWNVREDLWLAVPLGLVAVVAVAGLVRPASMEALVNNGQDD